MMQQKSALTPPQQQFRQFSIGTFLVLGGLLVAVGANFYVAPSLKQEMIAACALMIAGMGGILAIFAYLKLLVSRFHHLLERDSEPDKNDD